jgi:choline monooxygenase
VIPVGPERCSAFVDIYVRPGADEVIVDEWLKMQDERSKELNGL